MADVLVYHKPDSMGYPATRVVEASVLKDKAIGRQFVGSRLWLLTGEGTLRRYFAVREPRLVRGLEQAVAKRG